MAAIVTYKQATTHLGLGDEENATVRAKLNQATSLVLTYIDRRDHEWDQNTDPRTDHDFSIVQAAILAQLGELYRFRGDDDNDGPAMSVEDSNYLSPRVRRMLYPLRPPSLA